LTFGGHYLARHQQTRYAIAAVSARAVRLSKTVTEVSVEVGDLPDVGVSHDEMKSEEVYLLSL